MSQQWFILRGSLEHGPLTWREVTKLVTTGKLWPADLVCTARNRDFWQPAGTVKGLFGDNEVLQEAIRLAGVRPHSPDLQMDWWDNVFELKNELLDDRDEGECPTDKDRMVAVA